MKDYDYTVDALSKQVFSVTNWSAVLASQHPAPGCFKSIS